MGTDADEIMGIIESAAVQPEAAPAAPAETAPATTETPAASPPPQLDQKALAEWQAEVTRQTQANAEQNKIMANILQGVIANQRSGSQMTPEQIAQAVYEKQQAQQQGTIWDIPDETMIDGATMKAVLSQYGQQVGAVVQEVAKVVQDLKQDNVKTEMARSIEDAAKRYPGIDKRVLAGTLITTLQQGNARSIDEAVDISAKMIMGGAAKIEYDALPEEKRREIALRYAKDLKAKKPDNANFNPGGGQPPAAPVAKPLRLDDFASIQSRVEAGRASNLAKKGK